MALQAHEIEALIRKGLPDADVVVNDMGESHYAARVTSPSFKGKSRVQQHQMVYATLEGNLLSGVLHALALQTSVPE